jgi:glycosyltransferase involved in cell wall biosynthesis
MLKTDKDLFVLSIRLMVFNHAEFMEECLTSIDNQVTNYKFELVIGDDFSEDSSLEIIKQFNFKNKNISVNILIREIGDEYWMKRQKLGRLYNIVNILENCKGKYIAFLDGDDYWIDPYKLQKQVDLLESSKNLVACHHWQRIAELVDGNYKEFKAPKEGQGYLADSIATVKNIFSNEMRVKTRALMFRNVIDADFFPDWYYKVPFGDVPLSFLLGKYGDFGFIDEEMAVYRQTVAGVSTAGLKELGPEKFTIQHFKNWIEIWDKADRFYNYKYHKESQQTILYFFNPITKNLPDSYKSYLALLKFNIFERDMSFLKTLPHSIFIIQKSFPVFKKKLSKRIKSLI